MTTPTLSVEDETLLDEIGRRLAAVDDELPRLTTWRVDRAGPGQLHVVRGRTRRARATRVRAVGDAPRARPGWQIAMGAMAAVVAVAVVMTARLGTPSSPTDPHAGRVGGASSARATDASPAIETQAAFGGPSPSTEASSIPTPQPSHNPSSIGSSSLGVDPTTITTLLDRVGTPCGVLIEVALLPLDPAMVRKLAVSAGLRGGYLPDGYGPGWIGSDPAAAARAMKGRILYVQSDATIWIARGDGSSLAAVQLVASMVSPTITAWRLADTLWPTRCPPPGTDPKVLIGGRPATDWPTGVIVNLAVVRATTAPAGPAGAHLGVAK